MREDYTYGDTQGGRTTVADKDILTCRNRNPLKETLRRTWQICWLTEAFWHRDTPSDRDTLIDKHRQKEIETHTHRQRHADRQGVGRKTQTGKEIQTCKDRDALTDWGILTDGYILTDKDTLKDRVTQMETYWQQTMSFVTLHIVKPGCPDNLSAVPMLSFSTTKEVKPKC